jgi:DNA-binding winged helix-turn-helix (wHTH) protein/Flp pilus assembly protein TadD
VQDEYIYEFGPFQLNPAEHLLLCNGQPVPVTAKAFQTLLVLVRNRGHLVDKSQIINAVWGETFVEEGNLSVTISMLRKVLGDDRSNNKYIETVSKQGYRFLPAVTKIPAAPPVPTNLSPERAVADEPLSGIATTAPLDAEDGNAAKDIYRSKTFWLAAPLILFGFCIGLAFQLRSGSHASRAWIAPVLKNLENELEAQVVETIHRSPRAVARSKEESHDPEAYQLYIEGRYFWNKRTKDGFRHSIECFQRAVLKDPGFANAYAGLADSYVLLASYGIEPPEEAYPNAKAAALKAVQLDDSLAETHTSLGMVALYYEWDWPKADREFRRAIELDPNYSLAYTWDALYRAATGQPEQAVRQAAKAKEIEPLSLLANRELGRAFYWNHKYDEAIANFQHTIELDPYWARGHTGLGMALVAEKDYAGGIREFQEARKLSGPDAYLDGLIAYSEIMGGNAKAARRTLADLTDPSQHRYVPAFSVALVYLALNQKEQAMDWLEKAYKDRSTYMVYAKVDPLLSPLRNEPRFIALISRMVSAFPEQASAKLSSE